MNKGVIAGLVAAALMGGGAYFAMQGKLGGASGAQSLIMCQQIPWSCRWAGAYVLGRSGGIP